MGEGEHDVGRVAVLARDVDRFAAPLHRLGHLADEAEEVLPRLAAEMERLRRARRLSLKDLGGPAREA